MPPEVELIGLDRVEYNIDFFPEFAHADEQIVLPDGSEVPSAPYLMESYNEVTGRTVKSEEVLA